MQRTQLNGDTCLPPIDSDANEVADTDAVTHALLSEDMSPFLSKRHVLCYSISHESFFRFSIATPPRAELVERERNY